MEGHNKQLTFSASLPVTPTLGPEGSLESQLMPRLKFYGEDIARLDYEEGEDRGCYQGKRTAKRSLKSYVIGKGVMEGAGGRTKMHV